MVSSCLTRTHLLTMTLSYYVFHMGLSPREENDPDMMLTFDLKVKFIGFMTWLCVQVTAYLSFDIVILWVYHHGTMCRTHSWPLFDPDPDLWRQYQKCIFSPWIWPGKILFALWHKHTNFGIWVYYQETTCCVHSWQLFDLDLWPIWGDGGILNEFYS